MTSIADLVDVVFKTALGRHPEPEIRDRYAAEIQTGALSIDDCIREVNGSVEAMQRLKDAGDANREAHVAEIVDVVFRTGVGRSVHPEDCRAWLHALLSGEKTVDELIKEVTESPEAALKNGQPIAAPLPLVQGQQISEAEHYEKIVGLLYQIILRRPVDGGALRAFATNLQSGSITIKDVTEQLMGSEEVRLRILRSDLPDILEGIYRALMGAPEANPEVRELIRGALSPRTTEIIRTMVMSSETQHYLMDDIIKNQIAEFH